MREHDQESGSVSALEDRLRLFAWRELGGREPWELAFAGAQRC